ncbi:MAG: alpha-glucan family phosphorylase [Planctomycetaceae bacterium]
MSTDRSIAYFSMEIALEPGIPTYAGGLGILAGDTVRSMADLKLPMVAVSLVHRKGYFRQRLDPNGQQHEDPADWQIAELLTEMPARTSVTMEGRDVQLRAWKFEVTGVGGHTVPVYLLDADLPENSDWDRTLTHYLYGGDSHYRLCQEVVLGIGGARMLEQLGYTQLRQYHMNEGHASLLTLELLDRNARQAGRTDVSHDDVEAVHRKCIFTTHTPVAAGHDQFPMDLVTRVLGRKDVYDIHEVFCCEGVLNMTFLSLNLSHYDNGVAKRHGLVSQHMFARYVIDSITNGVHAATWAGPAFAATFDRHIPGWREDNYSLRYALSIPPDEIWDAHQQQKNALLQHVNAATRVGMQTDVLTIGFARRMTAYKRPHLLFDDISRLRQIAGRAGNIQFLFAGKAHPRDDAGKELIKQIFSARDELQNGVRIAFLENYDMALGRLMTAGVDVWLNTPEPPLEASGTSGMKAALNGVPSLSIRDGWWLEGCIEGLTGWAIGEDARGPEERQDGPRDAASLYDKLERAVLPTFYEQRPRFIEIMRHAIALNGSFFNTQRMLGQYVVKAYFS